jgi:TonB family protein
MSRAARRTGATAASVAHCPQWRYTHSRMNRHSVLLPALCAAGLGTALAQAPSPVVNRHVIVLSAHRLIVECDDQGTWTRVFATESEPVSSTDAETLRAVQGAASRRAAAWMTGFLNGQAPVSAVERDVSDAVGATGIGEGRARGALSVDAQRRLAAGLVELRTALSTKGEKRPVLRWEAGYDPDKSVAWGRQSVRNPAVAVTDVAVSRATPSPPGGTERERGAVVGGIVGSLKLPPPIELGGNIAPPIQTYRIQPIYPSIAQSARIQGAVVITVLLGTDGKVRDAHVLRSIPLLDAAALEAVQQWEWMPLKIDGIAVPIVMTVTVNFALQ